MDDGGSRSFRHPLRSKSRLKRRLTQEEGRLRQRRASVGRDDDDDDDGEWVLSPSRCPSVVGAISASGAPNSWKVLQLSRAKTVSAAAAADKVSSNTVVAGV